MEIYIDDETKLTLHVSRFLKERYSSDDTIIQYRIAFLPPVDLRH
jgi:hypothetical protein